MNSESRWVSIEVAAQIIGVKPKTAYEWAAAGLLAGAKRFGRNTWRVDRSVLEAPEKVKRYGGQVV